MKAIEIHNLIKEYPGHNALKGITFSVEQGSIHGFLGPNGAGKTTTLKIITGLLKKSHGNVSVMGKDIDQELNHIKKLIGYLPENPPLYHNMTVTNYLEFIASIRNIPRKKIPSMVDNTLYQTGLVNKRQTLIGKLSKGFQQKVGIAQALVHNPSIVIFDEPTVGLDPSSVIEFRNLLTKLKGSHTILISTHLLTEASLICDDITIINEGKILINNSLNNIINETNSSQNSNNFDLEHFFIKMTKKTKKTKKDEQSICTL